VNELLRILTGFDDPEPAVKKSAVLGIAIVPSLAAIKQLIDERLAPGSLRSRPG
jgi:hypothetical protein